MKNLVVICLSLLLFSDSYSQDFQKTLQQFTGAYVPERIHFHFDKTSYSAGDTVWFKAYLVQGVLPSDESKTLYVDWTDTNGKLVGRSVSPIISGSTFGQIAIPAGYSADFLHVKAYTRWMLNFDTDFLYNKDLRIITNGNPISAKPKTTFALFPEGGNLIEKLVNKVAFKATDQYGRPVKVTGNVLIDGVQGDAIKSVHDGMGYFNITPQPGKKYEISWKDEFGTTARTPLSGVIPTGVILKVADLQGKKTFEVQSTDPAISAVHVIGTMYQQPVFNISRALQDGTTQAVVPVEALPSGILTITVLDQQFHPLAERITFINNHEYGFNTEMNVQHWGLNKRARNEVEISIPDSLIANLSISVTDQAIDFDSTQTIVSDLLLSSEIKGKVYNPAFYFSDNSDSASMYLDLVMLTNGWRKISWIDLANGKLPEISFLPDTSYQTVSGKIYGATPTQLASAGELVLIVDQKNENQWMTAPINKDGSFDVKDFMLFDTATIYYQPPKEGGLSNISVQFMQNRVSTQATTKAGLGSFVPNPDTSGVANHAMLSRALQEELKFFQGKVLETVTITAKKADPQKELDEKYASGLFSGGNGHNFDLRSDPVAASSQNIFQYLQGRVAGLTVSMTDPPTVSRRGGTPALFLNEMPVDASMLSGIPVTDIAYVKVLDPPFIGAIGGGANGAIAIYTRKGGDVQAEPGKGLSKNTVTGYSAIRRFYSPNYEVAPADQKDLRTTLYWNPDVTLTPQNRKVVLQFFNNDITESFRVVIEGMTRDGKLTRLVQAME